MNEKGIEYFKLKNSFGILKQTEINEKLPRFFANEKQMRNYGLFLYCGISFNSY